MAAAPCPTCALPSLTASDSRTERVSGLLSGQYSPTPDELRDFQLLVDHSEDVLADLDQRILRLTRARNAAASHAQDAKCILHPIQRLPPEILCLIFELCVPLVQDNFHDYTLHEGPFPHSWHPCHPPGTLALVCRRWRGIALSQPDLWTSLRLGFNESVTRQSHEILRTRTSLLLSRSGTKDISVAIDLDADDDIHEFFLAILGVLETSMHRWRHLYLFGGLGETNVLQHLAGNDFPRLTDLQFGDSYGLTEPISVFRDVTSLRRFELMGSYYFDLDLPWSHLTEYVQRDAFDLAHVTYLRLMTSLRTLTLMFAQVYQGIQNQMFHLPHLRELRLVQKPGRRPGQLKEFAARLETPALEHLVLAYPIDLTSPMANQFPSLPSPMPSLRKLSLRTNMTTFAAAPALLAFLQTTPHVEFLHIVDKGIATSFLIALGAEHILPELKRLDIGACEFADDLAQAGDAFMTMLATRSASRLSEELGFCRLEEVMVPTWVRELDKERWSAIAASLEVRHPPADYYAGMVWLKQANDVD